MKKKWISIPLSPLDCVSTAKIKIQYEITTKDLLIETLIRKAKIVKSNTYELFEIPFDFLVLVNSNIIDSNSNLFKSNKCL